MGAGPVFVNPCANGDPALSGGRPVQCGYNSNNCGSGYFCHLGADAETTVCCPGCKPSQSPPAHTSPGVPGCPTPRP